MAGLSWLGPLVALSAALLLALPYDKELSYGFQRNTTLTPASAPITVAESLPYTRHNIRFDSKGTSCDAWLYTPLSAEQAGAAGRRLPVVIMAHGLGGQKDLGLHRFADGFARAGIAAFVFDYRTFGGSDGEPRHWVSPRRHLEDWRAAVRFVKAGSLGPEYDTDKVALWGTSFAGGHVLVVASELPPDSVSCVISMVPHLDGLEVSKASLRRRGLLGSLRLLAAGLHDKLRSAVADVLLRIGLLDPAAGAGTGLQEAGSASAGDGGDGLGAVVASLRASASRHLLAPAYIKTVGREGKEMALMQLSEQELRSYYSKHPAVYEGGWRPRVLSRFTLEASAYRPIESVPRLQAPVLFVAAAKDGLCPPELVRRAAELVPGNESLLLELDCSHFDAYHGDHLHTVVQAMVNFARQHLLD